MSMRKRVQKALANFLSVQMVMGFGLIPVAFQTSHSHAASQQGSDLARRTQSASGSPCKPDPGVVNSFPPEIRAAKVQAHYAACQPKFEKMMQKAQEFDEKFDECVARHGHYDSAEMATYLGINNKIGSLASAGGGGIQSKAATETIKTEQAAQSAKMDQQLNERRQCLQEAGEILQEFDEARNEYNAAIFLDKKVYAFSSFEQNKGDNSALGKQFARAAAWVLDQVFPSASASGKLPVAQPVQPGDSTEPSAEELNTEQTEQETDENEKKGMDKNMLGKLLPLLAIAGIAAAMMGGGDDDEPQQQPGGTDDDDEDDIECADGEVPNEDGTACVADTDEPCEGEGMERNELGVCVVADGRCTIDQYPDDEGVCVDRPSCEEGEYFNVDVRSCVAKTCDAGQILSADGSCVDDGDETIQIADPDAIDGDDDDPNTSDGDDGLAGLSSDDGAGGLGGAGAAGAGGSSGGAAGTGDGSSARGFGNFQASGRSPAGAGGFNAGSYGSNSKSKKKNKNGRDSKTIERHLRWKNPVVRKTLQEAAGN